MAQQPSVAVGRKATGWPRRAWGRRRWRPEGHPAARLDLADLIVGAVGRRRQLRGIGPGAAVIATGGHGQGQALVRPDVVVLLAPGVEGRLPGGQVREDVAAGQFPLQRPVEALVLAQRLRVIGAAVADGDAQAAQPDVRGV